MLEKLIKQQDSLYQLKNGLLKHHRRNMKETQAFERAVKMLQKHIGNTVTESKHVSAKNFIDKCIGELLTLVVRSSVANVAYNCDNFYNTAKTEAIICDLLSDYTMTQTLDALMSISSGRITPKKAYAFYASCGNVTVTVIDEMAHVEIENETNIKPIVVKKSSDFGKTLTELKDAINQISINAVVFYQKKAKKLIEQHGLSSEDVALLKKYA